MDRCLKATKSPDYENVSSVKCNHEWHLTPKSDLNTSQSRAALLQWWAGLLFYKCMLIVFQDVSRNHSMFDFSAQYLLSGYGLFFFFYWTLLCCEQTHLWSHISNLIHQLAASAEPSCESKPENGKISRRQVRMKQGTSSCAAAELVKWK